MQTSSDANRVLIIADFNADNLAAALNNEESQPKVDAICAPLGQTIQTLLDANAPIWQQEYDYLMIWTQPESIIESYKDLVEYKVLDLDKLSDEVEAYCKVIKQSTHKFSAVFVPTWFKPSYQKSYSLLEGKAGYGFAHTLAHMNIGLMNGLADQKNIHVLDATAWVPAVGNSAFNDKMWYMAKIPYSHQFFRLVSQEIKSAIRGVKGQVVKLVVLDLDDTLWGGIVGDAGWENLTLGGHDPVGESYVDFQRALQSLTRRGIMLGIVSKNEEKTALEAINSHPEMILKEDDFVGWRINWHDKAANMADLVDELNLGLQSVAFIDDNPVERARVKETLPEVLVPDWPTDKTLYKRALLSLDCFNTSTISAEDLERTKMYKSEARRTKFKNKVNSIDDWLQSIGITVRCAELNQANLPRTAQLFNKTNQMNLRTRRMTDVELEQWAAKDDCYLWTIHVSDKFGDSGLTGIISITQNEGSAEITDFILSCRVMGRRIENVMVALVSEWALRNGMSTLSAQYFPTKKNKPCYDFWKSSGFGHNQDTDLFTWDNSKPYPMPPGLIVEPEAL